ncbi:uncharacterized protein E0L32_007076 [Thyridium curvatum]|uniref:C2H2-type domain-containing protein n=1 Tax=Thyridium curvatum TaxID=1093900 RepID=A0A507B6D4_9PEZI|nr:uncharacterized protein E0L32_007076 [Thyridium curvatum]TPX12190.1 hypothetical protein E0L32_007076 [Thyridium curvatum]
MDPPSKRRRLAPKVSDPPAHPPAFSPEQAQSAPQYPPPEAPERHDFEAFARHLQDAAMLIYRQTQKSPYTNVSVLLLRWEEDTAVDADLMSLETVLRERYHYHTDKWQIPTVPNPSIKLGVQMASFLENARPDHLLIIYYAGYGFVGADSQLYWACNAREDAAKLKWDGVRCLFEDAQSDILLLLDSCAVWDAPKAGSHGKKQAIAAYSPDQSSREAGSRSFTSYLVESLHKLSTGRPFSVHRLYEEILLHRRHSATQVPMTNGASRSPAGQERIPVQFMLTPGKEQNLSLAPLPPGTAPPSGSVTGEADGDGSKLSREDHLINPSTVVDLTFDEARVLVCTTFVGEASPDMAFFNQWVSNMPSMASKITVEGMFLGPPTMLLISMPHSVWNVVQHDKVCCFLGYISSHNMTHLYHRLLGSAPTAATAKDVADGRILLEAREAAAINKANAHRYEMASAQHYPATPTRADLAARPDARVRASAPVGLPHPGKVPPPMASKDDGEDSAEMKEAAEQLKALSHIRTLNSEAASGNHVAAHLANQTPEARQELMGSPQDPNTSINSGGHYPPDFPTVTLKPRPRKSLQKSTPNKETRCLMCSHAPFKDYSSLRKHVAAAHTRPFPCAFSFAGCTSTFGSKNEWKRHIASQHLCLQFYRCSECPKSAVEGKGNEFNRKDLFTQHLRRMHAPFAIKKSIAKGDSKLQTDWEIYVKRMQETCLVTRRQPPPRSACPRPGCQSAFEGAGSWEEWTEHVGRHMENGEVQPLAMDPLLAEWALEEDIIEDNGDGSYRLVHQAGSSGDKELAHLTFMSETSSEMHLHMPPPEPEQATPSPRAQTQQLQQQQQQQQHQERGDEREEDEREGTLESSTSPVTMAQAATAAAAAAAVVGTAAAAAAMGTAAAAAEEPTKTTQEDEKEREASDASAPPPAAAATALEVEQPHGQDDSARIEAVEKAEVQAPEAPPRAKSEDVTAAPEKKEEQGSDEAAGVQEKEQGPGQNQDEDQDQDKMDVDG